MRSAFSDYAMAVLAAAFVAGSIIGWRRLTRRSRLVGWFFFAFLFTYVLRPLGTQVFSGDTFLYQWLDISPIEVSWWPMTVAVSAALLSVAIGYRRGRRVLMPHEVSESEGGRSQPIRTAFRLSLALIGWGYASVLISSVVGGSFVAASQGQPFGVASGTTAWLSASDLFVSTGVTLLYIVTGRLSVSLLLAVPWLASTITSGYGRINVIGLFMALLCVSAFLRPTRHSQRSVSHAIVILSAVGLVLLVFFAGTTQSRTFFANNGGFEATGEAFRLNFNPGTWFGTTSDIMGYETTLYHLQHDREPAWGTHYLYYFVLQPIPRLLWHSKPIPTTLADQWFGIEPDTRYLQLGLAPGAVGMAFQQWGWLGIPLEFIFTGWFFRRAEEWAMRRHRHPHVLLGYAGLFSLLPQVARDGLLYMLAERWLFIYGLPVFVMLLADRAQRRGDVHAAQRPSWRFGPSSNVPSPTAWKTHNSLGARGRSRLSEGDE
jgi:oligosaccharide repeat unit polymerase